MGLISFLACLLLSYFPSPSLFLSRRDAISRQAPYRERPNGVLKGLCQYWPTPKLKCSLGTRTSLIFFNPLSSTLETFGTLDQVHFLNSHFFSSHVQGPVGALTFHSKRQS